MCSESVFTPSRSTYSTEEGGMDGWMYQASKPASSAASTVVVVAAAVVARVCVLLLLLLLSLSNSRPREMKRARAHLLLKIVRYVHRRIGCYST